MTALARLPALARVPMAFSGAWSSAAPQAIVTADPRTRYQTILGWGKSTPCQPAPPGSRPGQNIRIDMTRSGGIALFVNARSGGSQMEQRQRILEAAVSVIAAKGFHQATMREIARAAGVATGTVYLYFKGKRDLLNAFIGEITWEAEPPTAKLTRRAALEALQQLLTDWSDFLRKHRGYLAALISESMFDARLARRLRDRAIKPVDSLLRDLLKRSGVKDAAATARMLEHFVLHETAIAPAMGDTSLTAPKIAAAAMRLLTA